MKELLCPRHQDAGAQLSFVFEEPPFAIDAAAIAGKRAVGPDDSMAGHNHANGIRAIC